MSQTTTLLFAIVAVLASRKSEWAAKAAGARQATAVSDGCTVCHRAFAREAPVIKP
jgi:cytochrome c5